MATALLPWALCAKRPARKGKKPIMAGAKDYSSERGKAAVIKWSRK